MRIQTKSENNRKWDAVIVAQIMLRWTKIAYLIRDRIRRQTKEPCRPVTITFEIKACNTRCKAVELHKTRRPGLWWCRGTNSMCTFACRGHQETEIETFTVLKSSLAVNISWYVQKTEVISLDSSEIKTIYQSVANIFGCLTEVFRE